MRPLEEFFPVKENEGDKKVSYGRFDDYDKDAFDESFGGRKEHKKRSERKDRTKRGDQLVAQDLTSLWKAKTEVVGEKTEPLWYPELPKQLVEATGYRKDKEKDEDFLRRKESALKSLEEKIPKIRLLVNEFGPQIHWAGKMLSGDRGVNPWGDLEKAQEFLKNELNIVKKESKTLDKKDVVKEKKPTTELSFEDREQIVKNADFGGVLFPAYKRYINGESLPAGLSLDNVMSQVKNLFPSFDVQRFAEESRKRILEKNEALKPKEKSRTDWKDEIETDPELKTISELSDDDKWRKQMEKWSAMDETERNNDMLILRALVRIRAEGRVTREAMRLWDGHNTRLEELGLMI